MKTHLANDRLLWRRSTDVGPPAPIGRAISPTESCPQVEGPESRPLRSAVTGRVEPTNASDSSPETFRSSALRAGIFELMPKDGLWPRVPLRNHDLNVCVAQRAVYRADQILIAERLARQSVAEPSRRAGHAPAPTIAPIAQNSAATPSALPTRPKASGITVLEKLIVIDRSAMASP